MTKYPQSHLGYAVNGMITFKPKRTTLTTSDRKAVLPQRGQYDKKNQYTRRENNIRFKEPEMEDLKNACKTGDRVQAFKSCFCLCEKRFGKQWRNRSGPITEKLVSILFAPNLENRTATYYAAHTGHPDLVHIFLSMLVISKAPPGMSSSSYGTRPKTISDWLDQFGFPVYFGRTNFETCILNALSSQVEAIFCRTKYSLMDLATTNRNAVFREYKTWCKNKPSSAPPTAVPQNRSSKKRRPVLIVKDDDKFLDDDIKFDVALMHDGCCGDQASLGEDELQELQACGDCIDEAEQTLDFAIDLEEHETLEAMIELCESLGMDDMSRQVLPSDDGTANDEKILDDEWSFVTPTSAHDLANAGRKEGGPDNDCLWEVTSEVGSVVTLDDSVALKEPYLEVARKGRGAGTVASTPKLNGKFRITIKRPLMQQQRDEPLENELFDAHFVMEGVKCSHGGKQKLMFKGSPKIPREEKQRRRWNRSCRLGRWE